MEFMDFDVVIEQDEDGGFIAFVPALPGCFTQGDSLEEVLDNIKEAIEVYVEEKGCEKKPPAFVGVHRVRLAVKSI